MRAVITKQYEDTSRFSIIPVDALECEIGRFEVVAEVPDELVERHAKAVEEMHTADDAVATLYDAAYDALHADDPPPKMPEKDPFVNTQTEKGARAKARAAAPKRHGLRPLI